MTPEDRPTVEDVVRELTAERFAHKETRRHRDPLGRSYEANGEQPWPQQEPAEVIAQRVRELLDDEERRDHR